MRAKYCRYSSHTQAPPIPSWTNKRGDDPLGGSFWGVACSISERAGPLWQLWQWPSGTLPLEPLVTEM